MSYSVLSTAQSHARQGKRGATAIIAVLWACLLVFASFAAPGAPRALAASLTPQASPSVSQSNYFYGLPSKPTVYGVPSGDGGTVHYQYSQDGGITWASSAPTDAGSYKIRAVIDAYQGASNYKQIITSPTSYKIMPYQITVKSASESHEYDASPLTANGYDTTLMPGQSELPYSNTLQVRVTGTQTTAGSSANSLRAAVLGVSGQDNSSNYSIKCTAGTLTVTRAPITITAASASKAYDGTALKAGTYTVSAGSLKGGDAIASIKVDGSQTKTGSAINKVSKAVILNGTSQRTSSYKITYASGTLKVTKAIAADTTAAPASPTNNSTTANAPKDATAPTDKNAAAAQRNSLNQTLATLPGTAVQSSLPEPETPLAALPNWALLDLIIALLALLNAAALVVWVATRKSNDEELGSVSKARHKALELQEKRFNVCAAVVIIADVAILAAAFATQKIAGAMAIVDVWTAPMTLLLVVGFAASAVIIRDQLATRHAQAWEIGESASAEHQKK